MASNLSKKKKREKYSLSELKALGHELLSSRAHINNLPLLLTFVTPTSPPHYVLESLLSLHSFFTPLLPQLPSSSSNSSSSSFPQDDPDFIYRTWLRSKFDDFVASLINIAITSQSEQTLLEVVWDTIMEFVKVGNAGKFHSVIYHKFLLSIVHSEFDVDDVLLDLLATKYFKYIDVRYFTYISLEKLARTLELDETSGRKGVPEADGRQSKAGTDIYIKRIHYLLSHVHPMEASDESPEYEMWNGTGIFVKEGNKKKGSEKKETQNIQHNNDVSGDHVLPASKIAKKMKLKFSKAWITFLGLPLPIDVYKEVLVTLHQAVIPHLSNPLMLCDFLTRSYDIGGVISVMSLSSLFVLMTQYGLEYPNFYQKLYGLLEPSIFMAKYCSKFFELLDSCLKSPLLPAYLAAGFTKKLSRLAIMIPPSGALIVIALIHNLLRRHPSINFLVHRENSGETVKYDTGAGVKSCDSTKDPQTSADMPQNKPGIDHFDDEESNPIKTNAMRSSLWEIDTLRHHYCPPVSRFVLSLENDLTVRAKTTEVAVKDFSSGSYGTIFREEIRRRVKQVPLAFYKSTPTSLFSESEFPGWSFKFNEDVGAGPVEDTSPDITELQQNSTKRQRIECS